MTDKILYSELTERIIKDSNSTKKIINELNKQMVEELQESLNKDGHTHLSGFGTFRLKWNEEREGHNPQTGEVITIPAHNHIVSHPDASVQRVINKDFENLKPIILDANGRKEPEEKNSKIPAWIWALIALLLITLVIVLIPSNKIEKSSKEKIVYQSSTKEVDVFSSIPLVKHATKGGDHIVKKGDDLWDIANKFYGDKYLWPSIYEANINKIKDPDFIQIGEKLIVPPFDGSVKHWTKEDLREIAQSHMDAYFIYNKLKKSHTRYYLWIAYHADKEVYKKYLNQISDADKRAIAAINGEMEL